VRATDDRTLVIDWKRPFADAGGLQAIDFPPLPRHLLQQSFQQDTADAFLANAFWSRSYVGLGPYRLDRWEPGAVIEASAFDGYALGAPKIARIQVRWNGDPNTVVANLLAGEAHVAADDSLQFSHATLLRREWSPRSAGSVLITPTLWRAAQVQQRTDFASPRALLDVRVRRALAHSIDKASLNDALFDGQGIVSGSMIPPTDASIGEVERSIRTYPFDVRQTEALLNEAGWTKGPDGIYTSATEGRFSAELKANAGAQYEQELSIMAAGWRQVGLDFRETINPAALAQDGEVRSTFSGVYAASGPLGEDLLRAYTSANIPRPENRWVGRNRVAWVNPEYDRLVEAFNTALEPAERTRQIAEMARIFTEDLPEIPLYFDPGVMAYVAGLEGPRLVAPKGNISWDIYRWTFN
jgi:peptide/nickel transport system substrate-binding protein